jgi:3-methyladenine DNA glycosylase AlkD
MSTPNWLKRLDDLLRPAYKGIAKAFLSDFLKKNNVPDIMAKQIEKIIPSANNEEEIIKSIMNRVNELERDNKELVFESNAQESVIMDLVQIMTKNDVSIDYETRLKIMSACDGE